MAQTHGPKYAPGYDLFKLLVAVFLVIVLIILLLSNRQKGGSPAESTAAVTTSTETLVVIIQPSLTGTSTEIGSTETFTLAPPTSIPATITPLPLPTDTPTQPATPAPTPTETLIPATDTVACPSAPSRIKIGDTIRVLSRLNFREGPGLNWPIILTNNPSTEMLVIGGPQCTLRSTPGGPKAYLWWNVRMKNGLEGWSAEASLINPNYFLDPLP